MLLKENFYKRRNEKAWSLWLLPLVILSCFVFSIQSFAQSSAISITTEQLSAVTIEKNSYTSKQLKALILQRGVDDKTLLLIAKILSRPNWQEHSDYPELLKALIEKGNNEVLMRIATEVLPHPELMKHPDLVEALILQSNVNDRALLLIAMVLSQPGWQKHPDYLYLMEALAEKGNNEVLKRIATEVLSHPDLMEHPELVKALIEKAGYISPGMKKDVAKTPSEFADKVSQSPVFLEILMEHPEILMRLATDIFPQLGWEKHPDLLKALIENAGPSVLEKIATNVLSQPHWLGRHPDLLDALIRKGNQRVLEIVAKEILSQRQWYGHPEPIEALIEKGKGDKNLYVLRGVKNFQLLGWIEQYIFKQRYWRRHSRFIELLKGKEVSGKGLGDILGQAYCS